MAKNAPWYPEYDQESDWFLHKLIDEKYNGDIDETGLVRWSSEWRMHRANGMSAIDAAVAVYRTIDAIRAGVSLPTFPVGEYDAQWLPGLDEDAKLFVPALIGIYLDGAQRMVDNTGWVRWSSDYRNHRDNGLSHDTALTRIKTDIFNILGIRPPMSSTQCRRPLVGPLRVVNKLLADDTGYRRVFGDSEFIALHQLKFKPVDFYEGLDDCVTANYQVRRIFASVGGWIDGWRGYEVVPLGFIEWRFSRDTGFLRPASTGQFIKAWSDYDEILRLCLREHRSRKIRIHLSFGDNQIILGKQRADGQWIADEDKELALHDRIARICAEEGGTDVIALYEICNEIPFNWAGGMPGAVARMARIKAVIRKHLPNVLIAMGAACSEEPADLLDSATYGDVCTVHTTREPFATCLKRTFGLVYWEGQYRAFPKVFWQGEPKGPNVGPMDGLGDDMYQPTNDPAEIVALYAMHALTGQGSNFFDGSAVRGNARGADAWGYDELPALFDQYLPEDIATWNHGSNQRGGIEYWWKGNEFRTSTFKDWDTSPPRPIATWTLFSGTSVQTGTGTPPRATGLLVGTFA